MSNIVTDVFGNAISSTDRESWLEARLKGVTATEAGKILANKNGREKLLNIKLGLEPYSFTPTEYMLHGIEREAVIASQIKKLFEAEPNHHLFQHSKYIHHLATPDGIADEFVVEIKAVIGNVDENIKKYYNQMQWQMHVLEKERCLFVVERHENFKPISVHLVWVAKDDLRISMLVKSVEEFMKDLEERKRQRTWRPQKL